jgi:NADH dehydrogenase [ubiquinone] 1 alpha subcomplex assembly factor 1
MSMLMTSSVLELDATRWWSINDGVMGGVSAGRMVQLDDGLRFRGVLSLENNGGFSSVRHPVTGDLSGVTHVRLEVRGDGREYQFRIRQNGGFDGIAWRAVFSAPAEWRTVDLPLDSFTPVFRGRVVPGAGPVIAANIQQIGFLLADGAPGAFELDIRHIAFVDLSNNGSG